MAIINFHHVAEVVAEHARQDGGNWVALTIVENRWDGRQKSRLTLFVDDTDLGKRLADAINAAQVATIEGEA
jgi:hypothetical protein